MSSDDLMDWILEQVTAARENGETLIAGMRHPLLPHYSGDEAGSLSDTIDNSSAAADKLADAGLEFVFSGLTGGSGYDEVQALIKGEGEQKSAVWDAALMKDGAAVQPDGPAIVTLPIPEGYDAAETAIYHIANDGSGVYTAQELAVRVQDGAFVFTADGLGLYAAVQPVNTEKPSGPADPAGPDPPKTRSFRTSPRQATLFQPWQWFSPARPA